MRFSKACRWKVALQVERGGAPVATTAGPGRIRADLAGVDPFPADLAWRRPDPARMRAGGAMEVPVQQERGREVRGDWERRWKHNRCFFLDKATRVTQGGATRN